MSEMTLRQVFSDWYKKYMEACNLRVDSIRVSPREILDLCDAIKQALKDAAKMRAFRNLLVAERTAMHRIGTSNYEAARARAEADINEFEDAFEAGEGCFVVSAGGYYVGTAKGEGTEVVPVDKRVRLVPEGE